MTVKHPRRMPEHVIAEARFKRRPLELVCQCGEPFEAQEHDDLARAFMLHRADVRGVTPSQIAGNPIERRVHRKKNRTFVDVSHT